jgi:hypothetical protein
VVGLIVQRISFHSILSPTELGEREREVIFPTTMGFVGDAQS